MSEHLVAVPHLEFVRFRANEGLNRAERRERLRKDQLQMRVRTPRAVSLCGRQLMERVLRPLLHDVHLVHVLCRSADGGRSLAQLNGRGRRIRVVRMARGRLVVHVVGLKGVVAIVPDEQNKMMTFNVRTAYPKRNSAAKACSTGVFGFPSGPCAGPPRRGGCKLKRV